MSVNPANYPIATLYVGDIDPTVSEAHLFEKFSTIGGPISSIRVCRDQITKHSLGYAYVNFQNQVDAERALDTMNFDVLNGRPMRIMWSQRDPQLRKSGVGNVFIKNLDKSIDNKALYDTFSTFGNILSCKIMIDEHGNSKGYGFVHFETQEAADKAINNVNDMLLNEKKVFVGEFMTKDERYAKYGEAPLKYTNVFVKNFGDLLDTNGLIELFNKFGEITSAVVVKSPEGKTKGYGFVNFKETTSAKEAVDKMNDFQISKDTNEKKLFVGPFQKKSERLLMLRKKFEEKKRERSAKFDGINLYIKNLDDNIDDEILRKEFSVFGEITSAKVMSENGRSKGFGFVCFSSPEEATRAVSDMKGRILFKKPLYVALAQRKEDRRSQLTMQYKHRMTTLSYKYSTPLYNSTNGAMFMHALNSPTQIFQQQMFPQNAYSTTTRPKWSTTMQPRQSQMQPQYQTFQMINQNQPRQRFSINSNSTLIRPGTDINRNNYNATSAAYLRTNGVVVNAQQTYQKKFNIQRQPNAQQSINIPGQEPLTTGMLAAAQPQEQKQMLGERIYPLVNSIYPELSGKITGMLLEIDNAELLHMLDSTDLFKEKVDEAHAVLKAHQAKQGNPQQLGEQ